MYASDAPPRRPNAFQPPRDKPALTRKIDGLPPLSPDTATDDETIRNRLRLLMAAEEGVGQILDTLQATGRLDNTLVIFTSDHGYFYGEHCLSVERRLAYEEAIRIPLLMRYPPLITPGAVFDQMILSIDMAPTLLELGRVELPAKIHGRSFLSLLSGQPYEPRTSFLIEHFSDNVFPRVRNMGYQAVRTSRWKYIHYRDLTDCDELYDLHADPYEMMNRIHDAALKSTIADLQAELRRLLEQTQ
jgi:N-acetylglucosamine-6-sulfatase